MGKAFFDNFLGEALVFRHLAFDKRYGAAQHSDITAKDAFDIFRRCGDAFAFARFEVWVHFGRLGHSAVDGQT